MAVIDNLKPIILDTKEEIEANTTPGKAAGALAVKEISENSSSAQIQCGTVTMTNGAGTISFPKPFKNIPVVTVSPTGPKNNTVVGVKVYNISAEGCEISGNYIQESGNVKESAAIVQWIAAGI